MEAYSRRKTRSVQVGRIQIGGDAPISVQTMTNVPSGDIPAVVAQILALERAGADLVRLTVPDLQAVRAIAACREAGCTVPLVADIHFDYRMAIEAACAGADKIRINPGNIGAVDRVREVVRTCRERGIPIRIGVNGGSLEKDILARYGAPTPEAMVESAMSHIRILERLDFYDILVSIKSSSVPAMIAANERLAELCDYPLHLGVTEAGTPNVGRMKSAVGIGSLLCRGIGDTIRVSLTADPVLEVQAGKTLLRSLEMDPTWRLNLISCPTCGRTRIDLIGLADEFEARAVRAGIGGLPITVAIMGCAVNGPGEARNADYGIAGGDGEGLLFCKGQIVRKVPEDKLLDALMEEIVSKEC